ncbi:abnormal spindle [Carabus blaptoides fortunei]
MFFTFSVSPKRSVKKEIAHVPEVEDIAELKLAPFSAIPKLFFEDVKIGDCITKKLLVRNPNSFSYKLIVTKLPPAERNVVVSWVEQEVDPMSDVLLELSWTPREEGSWRDVLSIVDSRNVKRDIAIVFKSVARKAKKRNVGAKTKSSVSVKAFKSPIKKFRSPKDIKKKRSPIKIPEIIFSSTRSSYYHKSPSASEKLNTFILESDKENSPMLNRNTTSTLKSSELPLRDTTYQVNSTMTLSPCVKQITPRRKHTYTITSDKHNSSLQRSSLTDRNLCDLSLNKLSLVDKINELNNSSVFLSPLKDDNIQPTPARRETYNIHHQPALKIISPTFSDNADNFNDSLEFERKVNELKCDTSCELSFVGRRSVNANKCDDLLLKIQSESFIFTPVKKISRNVMPDAFVTTPFSPTNCSTEMRLSEKSNASNISAQFSNPRKLFKANNTYELSPDMQDLSSGTFTHNVSGGTFIMGNLSSSTCIVLSPEFKEGIHNEALLENDKLTGCNRINTSSPVPIFPQASPVELNSNYMLNFSGINARAALSCIAEEELTSDTHSFLSTRNMSNVAAAKRKSDQQITVSPPKRAFIKPKSPVQRKLNTSWSKKLVKPGLTRKRPISTLRLNLNTSSAVHSKADDTKNTTGNSSHTCDPFLIATIYSEAAANLDPFISASLYYDDKWLEKEMNVLKKWLNALLTPPSELNASAESKRVDVARLWQDCAKKQLTYAPTKEKVSSLFHVNHRLDGLRKAARTLFHSTGMKTVLAKVRFAIRNNQLAIRDDKNLHLDVGLQSHVMLLLLCYNPLWLRIGLETIYGEIIPLESNSDVIGLSTFIVLRFFRDPHLAPKNKTSSVHNMYLPTYKTSIKKFTLDKFFMLVYFLDQAKTNKLIAHDPCLFCKDATVKESRELLLSFSRELLSAIGDVTKFLRRLGYAVGHKQSYLDEFDYAVKNLGVDLRDGIRLTKVMEIILLKPNLSNQLRGPAISRLQKVHNVKVAMDSLEQAGYAIVGDITAKDIVDGHREKTLSFLWQIINKFQSPRLSQAAIKIQLWWRSSNIVIKRSFLYEAYLRKIHAATKIQRVYRAWKLMQEDRAKFLRLKQAALTIQRFVRCLFLAKRDRVQYLVRRQAVLMIQQKYRAIKLMREQRQNYLQMKNATLRIQQYFRANYIMKQIRRDYLKLTETVVKIQRIFRARKVAGKERIAFVRQRNATIVIQRYFKATLLMRAERRQYLQRKEACVIIQRYFRATLAMKKERAVYLEFRTKVTWMQQHFRALQAMQIERTRFLQQKQAIITVQRHFRSIITMNKQRQQYLALKQSVVQVQQRFRANVAMKKCRNDYEQLKRATIIIQQRFRANKTMKEVRKVYIQQRTVTRAVQQRFRANVAMKKCRRDYQQLKKATVMVQQKYRANKVMKEVKEMYTRQRNAVILIQQQFRAHLMMKEARGTYLQQRRAAITIQQYFKAYLAMKQCKNRYQRQRKAAITIQQWYMSITVTKRIRTNYLLEKHVIITIQRRYRARVLMKHDRMTYTNQRRLIIKLQQQFRANLLMKQVRENYLKQKQAAIIIQQRFRAMLAMKKCKETYLKQRKTVIMLQQRFRANWAMKQARVVYLQQRQAIITIQTQFRAMQTMKLARETYIKQRTVIVRLQQRFRAMRTMKEARAAYLQQKQAIIKIQTWFRATQVMKQARENYLQQRKAIIILQQRFRANMIMKLTRKNYLKQKQAAILIQQRFRAIKSMKIIREMYCRQVRAIKIIQQRFRATIAMRNDRETYLKLSQTVIKIQRVYRANLCMKKEREIFLEIKRAAVTIQQRFRAQILMKKCRQCYLQQRQAAIILQQKFRALKTMKMDKEHYKLVRTSVITIQQQFRSYLLMKKVREEYVLLKRTITTVQQRFRANQSMKETREKYHQQRRAIIIIQRRFRANIAMKQARETYLQQIRTIIMIQRRFRANLAAKQAQENHIQQIKTVIMIQRRFRANLAMKQTRNEYLQRVEAIIKVQQRFRANLCMRQCRDVYLELRNVIISLQQRFRANVAMKKARDDYIRLRRAALVLQRHFRANVVMKSTRTEYINVRNSVIIIQRWFRNRIVANKQKRHYLLQTQSAGLVQRYFRGYLEMRQQRRMFLQIRESTLTIQRYFRSYVLMKMTRTLYMERKTAVIKVQRYYRGYLMMKRERSSFLQQKYATVVIQKYFRMYLNRQQNRKLKAAVTIQSWMRMITCKKILRTLRANSVDIEEKKQQRKMSAAATKIQAHWRGYKVRSVENQRMKLIRQRTIEAANRALPELTAGVRNREAIEILTYNYSTSMKEIIRALTILDFTTRLFPVACIDLCDRIVERLYLMLACTNRSVPDMDACVLSVSVLINLVKYKPTSAAVWKVNFLDTLLSEILHWSNKDGLLFPYACTLLWLLAQNPAYCKAILNEENAEKMLRKAYQECERKQKMLSRLKKAPANTIQKPNIGAKTSTKKPNQNNDSFNKFSTPALTPDWGIINKQHPRTFQDSMFAIKCVLKKLNINY